MKVIDEQGLATMRDWLKKYINSCGDAVQITPTGGGGLPIVVRGNFE